MPWAKFDDRLIGNRKMRRFIRLPVPPWMSPPSSRLDAQRTMMAAKALWADAIIYCCRETTDGEITSEELDDLLPAPDHDLVRLLIDNQFLHDKPGCESPDCLGNQGLPIAKSGLYVVHDFAASQLLAAEWEARTEVASERAHQRWHKESRKDGCRFCYPPK